MRLSVPARMSESRTSMIGALLITIGPMSMSLYTPAMPVLVDAFHTSPAAIKLTLSLYFAGFALTQLVCGPVSDALGRRRSAILFLSIYFLGSIMSALAPTVGMLLVGRLVQGIGASIGLTTSRAIVRDQFTGAQSSRIMNMINIMLAIGPAMAPTIGGVLLEISGWQAIFYVMVGFGLTAVGVVYFLMQETAVPDLTRLKPGPLMRTYRRIFTDIQFISAALTLSFAVGALYTLATILPFVLVREVGLTEFQFGIGMLMQTGMYFLGSVIFRQLLRKWSAEQLVVPGLLFVVAGGLATFLSARFLPPSYLSVMVPVGLYAFGISFVMPHMTTAALVPFHQAAGSASAVMGFLQMGTGFACGLVAAIIGLPLLAFMTVIPAMSLICLASYLVYTRFVRRGVTLTPQRDANLPAE
jgi:MFS transporter, DHA1 family, multidrug resistance protein